jgi:hypothetical protein
MTSQIDNLSQIDNVSENDQVSQIIKVSKAHRKFLGARSAIRKLKDSFAANKEEVEIYDKCERFEERQEKQKDEVKNCDERCKQVKKRLEILNGRVEEMDSIKKGIKEMEEETEDIYIFMKKEFGDYSENELMTNNASDKNDIVV